MFKKNCYYYFLGGDRGYGTKGKHKISNNALITKY